MLSNFQLGAHPLLQTLLLGQPEFRETLLEHPELEQLRQRVIARITSMRWSRPRCSLYRTPDEIVGWDGNPAFDQRVFAESTRRPAAFRAVSTRSATACCCSARSTSAPGSMAPCSAGARRADRSGTVSMMRRGQQLAAEPAANARGSAPSFGGVEPVAGRAGPTVRTAIAERDAQIAELQQAVLELANGARCAAQRRVRSSAEEGALAAARRATACA